MIEGEPKIILVSGDKATELQASEPNGSDFLKGIIATLGAAVNARLIQASKLPEVSIGRTAPTIQTTGHTLELATAAYRKDLSSPELLGEFNQAFWNDQRDAMGVSKAELAVPDALYTRNQIEQFKETDFGLFVPEVVSRTLEGLVLLGKAFPRMGNWAFQAETTVLNVDQAGNPVELFGWMNTEKAINVLNTSTTQKEAEDILQERGRTGLTLNVYAVAGQQSQLLSGQFLDEVSTWTRVLSSRSEGQVLEAGFDDDGRCNVSSDLGPGYVGDDLGVRSVEVARA